MCKTDGPFPSGIFMLAERARNNGDYMIHQIWWPQFLSSKVDCNSTVFFLALPFCDSNGKVLKKKGKIM